MTSIEHPNGRSESFSIAGEPHPSAQLPRTVYAQPGQSIHALDPLIRDSLVETLNTVGGVLFRGFNVPTPIDFKRFAASFGLPLASYEFGSTPRSKVFAGVYSSTEYPAHQFIPLHNEQAYTRPWPSRIWFHCIKASETGGETPIADSRLIYQRMPEAIRELFAQRELLYVRNYSGALDLPWQKVFNTEDRAQVERYCRDNGIEWEWKADGDLRTRQRCAAVLQHPETLEWVWFNQAHLFHVSAIEPAVRASLLAAVGEENLPRHVYFGDGSAIPDAMLETVREVYRQTTVSFPWEAGDILMLDNRLVAHGRNPYTGDRKVIVAMA
ncbi:TauD/TfdA family dioxygenase [Pseudomonas sp. SDO528_S397]